MVSIIMHTRLFLYVIDGNTKLMHTPVSGYKILLAAAIERLTGRLRR
jgi:hypothetical protein